MTTTTTMKMMSTLKMMLPTCLYYSRARKIMRMMTTRMRMMILKMVVPTCFYCSNNDANDDNLLLLLQQ